MSTNKTKPQVKLIKRNLRCEFTNVELLAHGKTLAELNRMAVQLEEEKKRITDDYKAKLSSVAADASIIANNIRTGYEFRNVDCQCFFNKPVSGKKTILRQDTAKEVAVEDMTQDEMQEMLPLEDEKE